MTARKMVIGGARYKRLCAEQNLPTVESMTLEELRAEVEGGRIAYATLVEDESELREKVRRLESLVAGSTRASATTIALHEQDGENRAIRRVIGFVKGLAEDATRTALLAAIDRWDWRKHLPT